jgi:capsular polysaccharide export protein
MKKRLKKILQVLQLITILCKWYVTMRPESDKTAAFVFKVSKWKQTFMPSFLPEFDLKFIPAEVMPFLLTPIVKRFKHKVFIIWGFSDGNEKLVEYAKIYDIPIYRIEDGFVRSVGLGAMLTPPYSLCLDKKGMYFDSTQPSDLEDILNHYDFSTDRELMEQAKKCIELLKSLGISKYNHLNKKSVYEIYGKKMKKRILVIGQVEDDASIKRGSNKKWTNNDLVILASKENPEAEVIYKPHPDVLTGRRPKQSNPKDIEHLANVIEEPLSLVDSFQTIDHVYTITSLSGFEALLRGIPVTTLGAPFYSGWGLTDDRQETGRRNRTLSIEEIFAGAYILYPRYVDPLSDEKLSLEETIKRIASNVK